MKTGSSFLMDTNILVRGASETDPQHDIAVEAVESLTKKRQNLCLLPQNIIEFCNVATRPADKNGLGLTVKETLERVADFERVFKLLPEDKAIFARWKILVEKHEVKGKNVHDARIAASIQFHQIEHLLTFNVDDFKRFDGFNIVHPKDVL